MTEHYREFEDIDFADTEEDDRIYMTETIDNVDKYLSNNAFRIAYQTNSFFLPHIEQMIDSSGTIILRPKYQRRLRWTAKNKSKLIESLLLNFPIPPIFFWKLVLRVMK